jgi:DNA processing protein
MEDEVEGVLPLDDCEREAWIALSLVPGIGPTRHRRLREHFGGARGAWCADETELCAVDGLAEQTVSALIAARGAAPPAAAARQAAAVSGGPWRLVCLGDEEYPSLLGDIYDPPPVLWLQGQIPVGPRVAIVGSRRATTYGLRVAREFATALAAAGVTIVSGLARGIDTAAHEGAMRSGGRTLAVLGCGLDIAYPPENARLQGAIQSKAPI